MTLYYIETDLGCGIREAKNLQQAKSHMRIEAGELVNIVRLATRDEIEWVQAMGGYFPKKAENNG